MCLGMKAEASVGRSAGHIPAQEIGSGSELRALALPAKVQTCDQMLQKNDMLRPHLFTTKLHMQVLYKEEGLGSGVLLLAFEWHEKRQATLWRCMVLVDV